MIEITILAGIALSVGLVYVLFACVCLPFPRKRTGFSTFDNTNYDPEAGNGYSLYTPYDGSGDASLSSQVTFEPLPDILAKTVSANALKPRITCIDNERQKFAARHVSVFKPFPRSQLVYVKELGIGWFGQVLEGDADKITIHSSRSRVVIKLLKDDATPYEQHLFLEEAAPYRELDHPNVVNLLGLCTETVPFLTILEQSAYGDLKTYLVHHKREAESMVRRGILMKCLMDMAAGLACLHRHGYVHHDFACRNCLLMADMSVKIGDYGISEDKFREEYYDTGQDLLPVRWMAPESLIQNRNIWQVTQFTKETNIWSFGIAMWEVTELEKLPYFSMSDEDVLQKVVADKTIKLPLSHSSGKQKQKLNEVMQCCWSDITNRPSIEDIHGLIHQIQQETSQIEDFDAKWDKLPSKDSKIVKVEVHTSAQNKITKLDSDQTNLDLKKLEKDENFNSEPVRTNVFPNSKGSSILESADQDSDNLKLQGIDRERFDDGSFVVISDKNQRCNELAHTDLPNSLPDIGLDSQPVTPVISTPHRFNNSYQLTSTPVSRDPSYITAGSAQTTQNNTSKYFTADSVTESPVHTNSTSDCISETPKRKNSSDELVNISAAKFDKNDHVKVKRTLHSESESFNQISVTDVPELVKNDKPLNGSNNLDLENTDSIDFNRCDSLPESVDSKQEDALYDTGDIETVLEGGDICIHEIEDDCKNDDMEIEKLKLSIADALCVNNHNYDNERRNSDPESPDDYDTLVAKEIYMSKGMSIPPTKHTTPRSLTTIPEDSIAIHDMTSPGLKFIEPLEDSLFSMSAQDSFEWDDYIGEQLVGHVKNSENSPRQSMEFQDWTLDQDSSQESDSLNNSKMESKRQNSSSSSICTPYSSSDSEEEDHDEEVMKMKDEDAIFIVQNVNDREKDEGTVNRALNGNDAEENEEDTTITAQNQEDEVEGDNTTITEQNVQEGEQEIKN